MVPNLAVAIMPDGVFTQRSISIVCTQFSCQIFRIIEWDVFHGTHSRLTQRVVFLTSFSLLPHNSPPVVWVLATWFFTQKSTSIDSDFSICVGPMFWSECDFGVCVCLFSILSFFYRWHVESSQMPEFKQKNGRLKPPEPQFLFSLPLRVTTGGVKGWCRRDHGCSALN